MQLLTFLVFAAVLAVALGAGQFYVPRSYYVIDEEGHQSAPVALRRLRRSAYYPSAYYPRGGANANANANADAKADGIAGGGANANANANANAYAQGGEPNIWGGVPAATLGWGITGGGGGGGGGRGANGLDGWYPTRGNGNGGGGGGWGNDWSGWVGPTVGASQPSSSA